MVVPAPEHAFFYPSRLSVMEVTVRGVKTVASQDVAAACHEIRHFIDKTFLDSLGSFALVPPQPPCARMTGTKTDGERVLGMLPEPLAVQFVSKRGGNVLFDLSLDHVLVVDRLPVPLHISLKSLFNCPGAELLETAVHENPRVGLSADAVPEPYRQHPFWVDDGQFYIGMTANYDAWHGALIAAAGDNTLTVRTRQQEEQQPPNDSSSS
mmetsp:Transcript_22357/g.68832  ORF Transcript_22357/g.68832 Transcript_22357/m.68832 type:complete len:210 (+) Transcript_22357:75-704(+)